MKIDEARDYLVKNNKPEYAAYIITVLAGDFAVEIAKEHVKITKQFEDELKWHEDNTQLTKQEKCHE